MRLSREKIVRLSHQITDVLVSSNEVDFVEDRDTIRQQVVLILTAILRDEEKADAHVCVMQDTEAGQPVKYDDGKNGKKPEAIQLRDKGEAFQRYLILVIGPCLFGL